MNAIRQVPVSDSNHDLVGKPLKSTIRNKKLSKNNNHNKKIHENNEETIKSLHNNTKPKLKKKSRDIFAEVPMKYLKAHQTGTTHEEVKAWRDARRKNYPTQENIEKRKKLKSTDYLTSVETNINQPHDKNPVNEFNKVESINVDTTKQKSLDSMDICTKKSSQIYHEIIKQNDNNDHFKYSHDILSNLHVFNMKKSTQIYWNQ